LVASSVISPNIGSPLEANHRLNGLCIAFAISFPTRSQADGSDMSAGSVRRSNSRRRSASSLDILLPDLTQSGLSSRLGMEVGRAAPLGFNQLQKSDVPGVVREKLRDTKRHSDRKRPVAMDRPGGCCAKPLTSTGRFYSANPAGSARGRQDERCRAGALRGDRRALERCTDARLVTGQRHRVEGSYRWLDEYCGGCKQVKPVDLAYIDVHPQACLTSLVLVLRCRCAADTGRCPRSCGSRVFGFTRGRDGSSAPGLKPGVDRAPEYARAQS
jgi:hypothetical protein